MGESLNDIIVLSICERSICVNKIIGYEFKFSGVFRGEKINKIKVYTPLNFTVGQKYLLCIDVLKVEAQCLSSRLFFSKKL